MSAWGFGSFENDNASDWAAALEEEDDFSSIHTALEGITRSRGKYLAASDCCKAIAAAEVVAALRGHPAAELPSELRAWFSGKPRPDDSLVLKSIAALEGILKESELKDLWADTEDFRAWQMAVRNVKDRLT